jgi:beta-glucanase (GH16 family)
MRTKITVSMMGLLALTLLFGNRAKAQLIWSDEFNGSSVNTANWTFETGAGGWGNNELEYYRSQNATVSGGFLNITAKRESFGGAAYTSARLKTQGKVSRTYGYMQARLKMPMGQGLWPAFWMLGNNIGSVGWPACGEIDIMEHVNATNTVYATIHWNGPSGYANYGGNTNTSPTNFHDYQINWNNNGIRWYIDGAQYFQANTLNNINSTEEFHRPFFFILNLAVGGNWPGSPNGSTPFPAVFQIDYVRIYQENGSIREATDDIVVDERDNAVRVFPNPVQETLNYTVPVGLENHTAKLYDLQGKEILTEEVRDVKKQNSINVSHVKSGYYVLNLHNDSFNRKVKVFKQ